MTDLLLTHTADGGTVTIANGRITLTNGIETCVYLSLFGGNEQDSGLDGDARKQWWGNLTELEPAKRYRSETQYLLHSLPLIPANLRRFEDAASRDLAWMLESDRPIARSIEVAATMPSLNTIQLAIVVATDERAFSLVFSYRSAE